MPGAAEIVKDTVILSLVGPLIGIVVGILASTVSQAGRHRGL